MCGDLIRRIASPPPGTLVGHFSVLGTFGTPSPGILEHAVTDRGQRVLCLMPPFSLLSHPASGTPLHCLLPWYQLAAFLPVIRLFLVYLFLRSLLWSPKVDVINHTKEMFNSISPLQKCFKEIFIFLFSLRLKNKSNVVSNKSISFHSNFPIKHRYWGEEGPGTRLFQFSLVSLCSRDSIPMNPVWVSCHPLVYVMS